MWTPTCVFPGETITTTLLPITPLTDFSGVIWGIKPTVTCHSTTALTIDAIFSASSASSNISTFNVTGPGYSFAFASDVYLPVQPFPLVVYSNMTAVLDNPTDPSPTDWMNHVLVLPSLLIKVYVCSVAAEQYLAPLAVYNTSLLVSAGT